MDAAPAGAADGAAAAPCAEAVTASPPPSPSAAQRASSSGTPGEVGTPGAVAAEQPGPASDKPAVSGSPPAVQPLGDNGTDCAAAGDDAHDADTTPPVVAVELGAEINALVVTLRGGDCAAQAAAGRRVAELAAGERDKPKDEAACAALLAAGAVAALRTPVTALLGGDAAAREAACASLRALCNLTDCHSPARAAVAAAGSGWLPALCALVQADLPDAVLLDLALHVLQYTTRGGAAEYAGRQRGAVKANAVQAASTCTLMCDAGVPSAIVACLRCLVAAGVKTVPARAPAETPPQEPGMKAEEGSQERVLLAAVWCFSNMCHTSMPPSCTDNPKEARINNNATVVYDAGAAAVLSALLLGARPLVVEHCIVPWLRPATNALGWCVEMHAARDATTTRNAIVSLVALLDPHLYGLAGSEAANHAKNDVFGAIDNVMGSLDGICTDNEACCDMVADTGGIRALLELFKVEHLTSQPQRRWISLGAVLMHDLLKQSTPCRRAFLAAGGFAAPVALLAATAHVAHPAQENAVSVACRLFACCDVLAPELIDALCSSGAVRALLDLMKDYPYYTCMALWNICEDKPAVAAMVRDCGGVAAVAAVLREIAEDPKDTQGSACSMATGLLMTLSNNDALAAAIADEKLLEPLAFIVHETNMEDARLSALLAVSCVYSGRADKDADALLAERDITRHLTRMLDAVLHHSERLYLKCSWSAREVTNYVRLAAVDAAAAGRLVGHGVVALLLELLACTADAAVQQHVCRALLSLSYVPVARAALLTAGAAAKVARFEAVLDGYTADAAKGLARRLADGGADGDSVGTAAAAAAKTSFRVFLSHKRTDAQDFARALHTFFKNEGVSAFLDYEFREDLHDLQAVISNCDNVIFILTENIFESYWCRVELCAAVRAGVNVILVRKEGAFWTCTKTGVRAEHPPESLINELEFDPDVAHATKQMLLTHKSVLHSNDYYSGFTALLVQKLVPPDQAAATRALVAKVAARALPAAPTGHSTLSHSLSMPMPSHTSANQAAAAAPHAAPHASPGAAIAHDPLQHEVLTLRAELAALRCAPVATREGGGAHMSLMLALLGGTVAVVGIAGCVAMVAIVAAAKQQRTR